MRSDSSQRSRHVLLLLACYALWLGLSALGVVLIFQARTTLFGVALQLRLNPWQVRAADQFGTVTIGLVWLVAIIILEHYLRQGVLKNRLWGRATRVFVVEFLLLALCYGAQVLLT